MLASQVRGMGDKMNITTQYMEFFTNDHKIVVWLEVRDGEYVLKEVE